MKHFGLCILTLGFAAFTYGSPSSCSAFTNFQQYINANSCTFTSGGQSYTLQDFTFANVSLLTPAISAADFGVSESAGANGPTVTLTPDALTDLSTNVLSTETILIGFDIVSNSASINFSAVNLGQTSSLSGPIGTTGTIAEQDCFGGLLPVNLVSLGNGGLACTSGGLSIGASLALAQGIGLTTSVPIQFSGTPTSAVDVLKEINLTASGLLTQTATASVSSITQGFSAVGPSANAPEPGSLFLGGVGLLGVALGLRRKERVVETGRSTDSSSK